jgi:hypothetical protein
MLSAIGPYCAAVDGSRRQNEYCVVAAMDLAHATFGVVREDEKTHGWDDESNHLNLNNGIV